MNTRSVTLEVLDIARPCPADWNDMTGDERVRFCRHCSLHVYNLAGMTRSEAENLVAGAEGRLCVRFYRRADGTVTTQDCDGWWRLTRRRVNRWTSAAVAMLLAAVGMSRWTNASATPKHEAAIVNSAPEPVALQGDVMIMGKIRLPTSQPAVIMGAIAPVLPPAPPPAAQPAATQPAD
jgi:hypothetical protein